MSPRCPGCFLVGTHSRTCPALSWPEDTWVTTPEEPTVALDDTTAVLPAFVDRTLTWTGVIEASQGHDDGRKPIPAWTLVAILAGTVMLALGLMLNDPVSRLVYGVIPR